MEGSLRLRLAAGLPGPHLVRRRSGRRRRPLALCLFPAPSHVTRGKRSEAGGSRTPSQRRHKTELGSSVKPQAQLPRRLAKPTRRPLPPSAQRHRPPPAPASAASAGSVRFFFQGTGRGVAAFLFPTGERENAAPFSCHLRESPSGARNLRLTARRPRSLSAGGKTVKKLGSGFLRGNGAGCGSSRREGSGVRERKPGERLKWSLAGTEVRRELVLGQNRGEDGGNGAPGISPFWAEALGEGLTSRRGKGSSEKGPSLPFGGRRLRN